MIEKITNGVFRLDLKSHTLPPFKSTNSYLLISEAEASIIDPGFFEKESLDIVQSILAKYRAKLKSALLTHSHRDHVEGVGLLLEPNPTLKIYIHHWEKHRLNKKLKTVNIRNNENHKTGSLNLKAIFTPGHSHGHLSFFLKEKKIAFVGDLLAKNSSTWVGLPDGNVKDYLHSLDKIENLELKLIAAGHGRLIKKPYDKIKSARKHRLDRLEQILTALRTSPKSFEQLREVVYPDLTDRLVPFANKSLEALVIKLANDSIISFSNQLYCLNPAKP